MKLLKNNSKNNIVSLWWICENYVSMKIMNLFIINNNNLNNNNNKI